MNDALQLAEALIARPSVTPDDAGCQELLKARLAPLGFECETLVCGPDDFRVTNLLAIRRGTKPGPTLAFAGHTDVVPPGPLAQWASDPFVPSHRGGLLYGRGAADMKGGIAAMIEAALTVHEQTPFRGAVTLSLSRPANDAKDARLQIINLAGQIVKTMEMPAGGSITWNGANEQGRPMVPGVYLARLYKGRQTLALQKLILVR